MHGTTVKIIKCQSFKLVRKCTALFLAAGGSDGSGTNGCISRNLEDARRGVRETLPLLAGTN